MRKTISFITAVSFLFLVVGCAESTKYFIKDRTNATNVSFDVTLDREFVKKISSIVGDEQFAMLILLGPFTNDGVLLVAKENIAPEEKMAFRKRLSWGKNNFEALLNNNITYQLTVLVQGTRTGSKDIGSIQIGSGGNQHYTINLLGNEVSIK